MNPRSKILLFVLVGLVLTWQVGTAIWSVAVAPIRERQQQLTAVNKNLEKKQAQRRQVLAATRRLKDWKEQSLPPEPLVAVTLYQNWLIELANQSGMRDATVLPNRISPKDQDFVTIPMTIRGETRMETLCELLVRFHQARLLQRVIRMSVEKHRTQAELLNVTLEVEGISLANISPRTTLFAADQPQQKPVGARPEVKDYEVLISRRIFEGTAPTPPPTVADTEPEKDPEPPTPPEPELNPAEHTYLVAAWNSPTHHDAWLYDRSRNLRHILVEGQPVHIPGFDGVTQKIGADYVILKSDTQLYRLDLGQNLIQLQKIAGGA